MWPVIITPGDKLRIAAREGYYSRNLLLSSVGDILGQKTYLVYTPVTDGKYIHLPLEDGYMFMFYTKNGLLHGNGSVFEHCVINGVNFTKIKVFEFERIQRRLFYRLNYLMDFSFVKVKDLSDENLKENPPVYKGVTKDLSGGGLRFFSDLFLEKEDHLIFKFKINDTEMEIEGVIRNKEELENHASKYDYRVEFVNIATAQQEKIIQFVFRVQRELIKKMKSDTEEEEK